MPLSTKLRDETLRLLKNRLADQTLRRISNDTSLPHTWLSMFGNGKIDDPSVNRIETLYQYLSGKPIRISAGE